MSKPFLIGMLALLLLTSYAAVCTASAYSYVPPFNQSISASGYSFVGQNFTVYVNDTNGFANYSVTAYVAGNNLTGLSPASSIHNFQASRFSVGVPV